MLILQYLLVYYVNIAIFSNIMLILHDLFKYYVNIAWFVQILF